MAKKAGLSFSKNAKIFVIKQENEIVGFTAILFYQRKVVFKNHFVLPEHRGKGIFKFMFDYSCNYTKKHEIYIVEANCSSMSLPHYLKNGAKIVKQYKDWTKVILTL